MAKGCIKCGGKSLRACWKCEEVDRLLFKAQDAQKQERVQELPLFETEQARYFFAVRQEYQPITGGISVDLSLRRQELSN
jgi:hypothetical protein